MFLYKNKWLFRVFFKDLKNMKTGEFCKTRNFREKTRNL